ncbi:unnamed protein product [Orchesella dallaii]|uniref:Odorant receptor n=1 Tax=Orchesella dallaii TaxID=48710 RepID=A0ABP1RJN2_9HEXA
MVTKIVLEIIQFQIKIGSALRIIPLKFGGKVGQTLAVDPETESYAKAWIIVSFSSILLPVLELQSFSIVDVPALAYHSAVLMISLAALLNLRVFHSKPQELSLLFNSMMKFGHTEKNQFRKEFNWKFNTQGHLINVTSVILAISSFLLPIVIPTVSAIFPCIHQVYVKQLCQSSCVKCSEWYFRLLPYVVDTTFMAPITVACGLMGNLCLMNIYCINRHLQIMCKIHRNLPIAPNRSDRNGLALYFRKLQILVILSNQCFQQNVWPNIQFTGAALMICLLYSIILFGHTLNFKLVLFMVFMLCAAMVFTFLILDVGSRPIILSKKLLGKWLRWRSEKSWGKFLRSCDPISLRVGPFHRMDRGRGPALIRFTVQRTFYLVVQSKAINCH